MYIVTRQVKEVTKKNQVNYTMHDTDSKRLLTLATESTTLQTLA